MPPGPGEFRGNVYTILKDVLRRPPEIDDERVHYRPTSAEKRYLEAFVDPDRLEAPVGPDAPAIAVKWKRHPPYDEYRIDYADPNVDFHCGWHRDDDHPEYGDLHFQYGRPDIEEPVYEAAAFDASTPPRILWTALDRLFSDVVPDLVAPLYGE